MQPPPEGHHPVEGISGSELRRDVSVWGSYMWGYAAVGADIYTALGIITLAALGLAPLAFLAAGIVFALVGLCYAELASAYPLAGGGQYFTLRGMGGRRRPRARLHDRHLPLHRSRLWLLQLLPPLDHARAPHHRFHRYH